MTARFFPRGSITFSDHPKFDRVRIAVCVTGRDSDKASVCMLEIAPAAEVPIHTHDPQADSIFVVAGAGKAYVNGAWQEIAAGDYIFVPEKVEHGIKNSGTAPLVLFVHHCPALL